jgi:hypothetical protein
LRSICREGARSVPPAAILVASLWFCLAETATRADELKPSRVFLMADEALGEMQVAQACRLWVSLLDKAYPYPQVALDRLAVWMEQCDLRPEIGKIRAAASGPLGTARYHFEAVEFARKVLRKYAAEEGNSGLSPCTLSPAQRHWRPATAPAWLALFSQGPADSGRSQGTAGPAPRGTLGAARYCFQADVARDRHIRIRFTGPGTATLDDRQLIVVEPDVGLGFPRQRYVSVRLEPGWHCLDLLQAGPDTARGALVQVLPAEGLHPADAPPPQGTPTGSWAAAVAPPPCREEPWICQWRDLAETGASASRDEPPSAIDSTSKLLLHLARLQARLDEGGHHGGEEDKALTALASFVSLRPNCLAQMELARRRIELAEDKEAQAILLGTTDPCRDSLAGLMVQADLAELNHWTALRDGYVQKAKDLFPENCDVLARWYELKADRGEHPSTASLPVKCRALERAEREFQARTVDKLEPLAIDQVARQFPAASRTERLRLTRRLPPGAAADEGLAALERLVNGDPGAAAMLVDEFLARGEAEAAKRIGRLGRMHPGTWSSVRMLAGRLFGWERLLALSATPETVISEYLASGFGEDMPQVLVLDEAVAAVETNGWLSLLETSISHVVSADAAEAVGEISLDSDVELVELAVRKADGTWQGPEDQSSGAIKETISLPGLGPGDFVVMRTIRELPPADPFCTAPPAFYFGGRDHPTYYARYLLLPADGQGVDLSPSALEGQTFPGGTEAGALSPLVLSSRGAFDRAEILEGGLLFEKRRILPQPEEPYCPDREAGLSWVQASSACLDWALARDRLGDAMLGICDSDLPAPFAQAEGPEELARLILGAVEPNGDSLTAAPFSKILESGRGNLVAALLCALELAGNDVHVVFVNSGAAQPLDFARPALSYFDTTLLYVAGRKPFWLDPFDRTSAPGYLRPALRDRWGLLATPFHPRLFVKTPVQGRDRWKIDLAGKVDGKGRWAGTLTLDVSAGPASELDRAFRNADDTRKLKGVQAILSAFLPVAVADGFELASKPPTGRLRISFHVEPAPAAQNAWRVLLTLPPSLPPELGQLGARTSPLFSPGFVNYAVTVKLTAEEGIALRAEERAESVTTRFGRVSLAVARSGRTVTIGKEGEAPPVVISPEEYPRFLEFFSALTQLVQVTVTVARE